MSQSTPADLAVAFRSLPRRLRQAADAKVPDAAVIHAEHAVSVELVSASKLMGCAPQAADIAEAIDHRQLSEWLDADLAELQAIAHRSAVAIRDLEDAAE